MRFAVALLVACSPKTPPETPEPPPRPVPTDLAPRGDLVETLHGLEVADPYRGLEDPDDAAVQDWVAARRAAFSDHVEPLPRRAWVEDRLQTLWRYDEATVRRRCLTGERWTWRTRAADQDKWVIHLAEGPEDDGRVVVDPNTWGETEQLASFTPSPDCTLAVVGRANAGDENPVLTVWDLDAGTVADDTLQGHKQGGVAWRHDLSGFWYSSKPTGDDYNHRVWWHALGTQADADVPTLSSDEDKNLWHWVSVSEDGRWQLRSQGLFDANRLWLLDLEDPEAEPQAVAVGMDGHYRGIVAGGRLLLRTDYEAPRGHVLVGDPEDLASGFEVLIPESKDTLESLHAVGGRLVARYNHEISTRLEAFDLEGASLGEIALPSRGTATVSGRFGQPDTFVSFQSFAHPPTTYRVTDEGLEVALASSMPVDPELLTQITVDQAWFTSPDGTKVPMYVVHKRDAVGPLPTLLTGYGGFNLMRRPTFSWTALLWVEAGGVFAQPNLRGGGEFGQEWHRAGMGANKQNVFDDFLTSATWLIEEGWTTPSQLAIFGRSNGGLLVSAALTQAPDRFGAALVGVPLADMVRFHRFGIAEIWTEEYGHPDNPDDLPHLLAYSPYHAVEDGVDYPAILVVGSKNDARTDPVHALKFAAAVRHADLDRGTVQPILLEVQDASGHLGAVTIDQRAAQQARMHGFLMDAVGL